MRRGLDILGREESCQGLDHPKLDHLCSSKLDGCLGLVVEQGKSHLNIGNNRLLHDGLRSHDPVDQEPIQACIRIETLHRCFYRGLADTGSSPQDIH